MKYSDTPVIASAPSIEEEGEIFVRLRMLSNNVERLEKYLEELNSRLTPVLSSCAEQEGLGHGGSLASSCYLSKEITELIEKTNGLNILTTSILEKLRL